MSKQTKNKKNSKYALKDEEINSLLAELDTTNSNTAKGNITSLTQGLAGGALPDPSQLPYVNTVQLAQPTPLPSVAGGDATPIINAQSQPTQPSSSYSSNAASYNETRDMNKAERDAAMARQETANTVAKDYNENKLPTLMAQANAMYKGATPSLDDKGRPIQMNPVPVLPQAIIPEKMDIPNMVTGHFGESFKESSGNRNPSPREKYKTPTIATPDYTKGAVNPVSPSSVFLDMQGGIRAANDAGNPSLGRKATDDNFGTGVIPKGTTAKMPVWMFNKQTGKYDFKGINDVDVGGSSMADVSQRVATSWIAHNLMNDINSGKQFNVKVKDKNGNIVDKQIPLVSNYGQEVGASQLKFAPSVFVQALGGDYNTAIADAYTKTVDSLGLPSGSVTYKPNSVVARRIEDKNSKAHQTWLGAKDNDLTGDTINGWGNSIINGLFGQMFGAK